MNVRELKDLIINAHSQDDVQSIFENFSYECSFSFILEEMLIKNYFTWRHVFGSLCLYLSKTFALDVNEIPTFLTEDRMCEEL